MEDGASKSIELDCGIALSRIATWLDDELSLPHGAEGWTFSHGQAECLVALEALESRRLGCVRISRTFLQATGDAAALDEFQRLFTLRFMSAGG